MSEDRKKEATKRKDIKDDGSRTQGKRSPPTDRLTHHAIPGSSTSPRQTSPPGEQRATSPLFQAQRSILSSRPDPERAAAGTTSPTSKKRSKGLMGFIRGKPRDKFKAVPEPEPEPEPEGQMLDGTASGEAQYTIHTFQPSKRDIKSKAGGDSFGFLLQPSILHTHKSAGTLTEFINLNESNQKSLRFILQDFQQQDSLLRFAESHKMKGYIDLAQQIQLYQSMSLGELQDMAVHVAERHLAIPPTERVSVALPLIIDVVDRLTGCSHGLFDRIWEYLENALCGNFLKDYFTEKEHFLSRSPSPGNSPPDSPSSQRRNTGGPAPARRITNPLEALALARPDKPDKPNPPQLAKRQSSFAFLERSATKTPDHVRRNPNAPSPVLSEAKRDSMSLGDSRVMTLPKVDGVFPMSSKNIFEFLFYGDAFSNVLYMATGADQEKEVVPVPVIYRLRAQFLDECMHGDNRPADREEMDARAREEAFSLFYKRRSTLESQSLKDQPNLANEPKVSSKEALKEIHAFIVTFAYFTSPGNIFFQIMRAMQLEITNLSLSKDISFLNRLRGLLLQIIGIHGRCLLGTSRPMRELIAYFLGAIRLLCLGPDVVLPPPPRSCSNTERPHDWFKPNDDDPTLLDYLRELGAEVESLNNDLRAVDGQKTLGSLGSFLASIVNRMLHQEKNMRSSLAEGNIKGTSFIEKFFETPVEKCVDVLSQISGSLMTLLCPISLLQGGLTKGASRAYPTTVKAYNRLHNTVLFSILTASLPSERAKVLERWANIAFELFQMADFWCMSALVSGITHSAVTRLKHTKKLLQIQVLSRIRTMKQFCSYKSNFEKYRRSVIFSTQQNIVYTPFLHVMSRDLTYMEEISTFSIIGEVQADKLRKVANILTPVSNGFGVVDWSAEGDNDGMLAVMMWHRLVEAPATCAPEFKEDFNWHELSDQLEPALNTETRIYDILEAQHQLRQRMKQDVGLMAELERRVVRLRKNDLQDPAAMRALMEAYMNYYSRTRNLQECVTEFQQRHQEMEKIFCLVDDRLMRSLGSTMAEGITASRTMNFSDSDSHDDNSNPTLFTDSTAPTTSTQSLGDEVADLLKLI